MNQATQREDYSLADETITTSEVSNSDNNGGSSAAYEEGWSTDDLEVDPQIWPEGLLDNAALSQHEYRECW